MRRLVAMLGAISLTLGLVACTGGNDAGARGVVATADTSTSVSESDEEWLRLIDEARERLASTEVVFPDPRLGEDVTWVDSCAAIPANAVQLEQMAELSTNEAVHRTIVLFSDPEGRARFALFLRSDMEYPACSEELRRLAEERPAIFSAVDAHICDQMELMARGQQRSDVTLRPASPNVAQAYLDTFCAEE
jgi:hypothetical protein